MGCDIHALMEKRDKELEWYWINKGDPEIGRDYEMFAVLANVRNYDNLPFISEPKGKPEDCSDGFKGLLEYWGSDAHSTSWLTLKELKEFDVDQEYESENLILSKDEKGKVAMTCRSTTGKHLGKVGKTKVFELWGRERWSKLIQQLEAISEGDDERARLVFFFDN